MTCGKLRALAFLAALPVAACSSGKTPLVIYSPHGRELLTVLQQRFEALHPDVDVRWMDMGSQEVLDRLRSERANPQADLWFGAPSPLFARGAHDSLLEPVTPGGPLYVSVYRTPAVIEYSSEALTEAEAPHDWDDVLQPKWRGKLLLRDPLASGTMRAIFEMIVMRSLQRTGDTAQGMAWLRRLDAQTKEYVLTPALLHTKLERQEGLISLWDLPDMLLLQHEGRKLGYLFPSSGTPVIDDDIAVVRGARHAALAREFVDWVRTPQIELLAAREGFRLPALGLEPPRDSLPAWMGPVEARLKAEPLNWDSVEARGVGWMEYWDKHVRGTGEQ
ncbi:MAG TPA: extracellular solute-binding protein [Gemmatimonadales bacterium]|nr:extracellular solute-binding protein [Gemmatimonadales bacterium]